MKIFVDDKRDFPKDANINCCRTYRQCILFLDIFREISFLSLDYDLGTKETGFDILVFLKENNITPKHINIHSDHEHGQRKMRDYLNQFFKETKVTFNRI